MAQEFVAELEEIYTGSSAGMENRWSACNFFDKVVLAQSSVLPIYWPGGGPARPVPGLDPALYWDGVAALAGHLLLWKDATLQWCDLNDFTMWIPVAQTAASVRGTLAFPFSQPRKGSTTDWVYFKEPDLGYVQGQYVRIEIYPYDPQTYTTNFYLVEAVASTTGLDAATIGVTLALSGGAGRLFTTAFALWPAGSKLLFNGRASTAVVTAVGGDQNLSLALDADSPPVPLPGQQFSVALSDNPTGLKVGDVVAFGQTGADLYKVLKVGFMLTLERLSVGSNRAGAGYVYPKGTVLLTQPWIDVTFTSPAVLSLAANTDITAQGAIKLTGLGLTGESPAGSQVPAGVVVSSVDANEAGQLLNIGSAINGAIWGIVELDEYGVMLKEKSIQTIQYTGYGNGTFYIRTELEDTGPIARNAWCRVDTDSIVFCGESEIYQYFGGKNIQPVAQQVTKEFFSELDRDRKDEIIFYQNKIWDQIWVAYPSLKSTGTRVLVWNYRENSAVLDDYSSAIGALTAIGAVHWELAPTWNDLVGTWNDQTQRWREYVTEGLQRYTLLACSNDVPAQSALGDLGVGVPRLMVHGRVFSRASGDNCSPQPYLAIAETADYDFQDPSRIKYVDTLLLNCEIRPLPGTELVRPLHLYVQFGCRDNLDSDLRWTSTARVEVSGNGMRITKVNLRGYGRFVRIRFFSQDIGVQWRVAGWELLARPGGTY